MFEIYFATQKPGEEGLTQNEIDECDRRNKEFIATLQKGKQGMQSGELDKNGKPTGR